MAKGFFFSKGSFQKGPLFRRPRSTQIEKPGVMPKGMPSLLRVRVHL